MCLVGTVVASWSLTQGVAGPSPFTVMTNIFVTRFSEFSEIFRKNYNDTRKKWMMRAHFETQDLNQKNNRQGSPKNNHGNLKLNPFTNR